MRWTSPVIAGARRPLGGRAPTAAPTTMAGTTMVDADEEATAVAAAAEAAAAAAAAAAEAAAAEWLAFYSAWLALRRAAPARVAIYRYEAPARDLEI